MSSYCLMHSSGQGPEGWKLLLEELEGRGHRVLTPAFHVSRTDEGLVYHAETIVEALEQSGLEFVFHDCPPERLEWALSTRVLFYAKRAMEEPCPLSVWPAVPAAYIVCAEDRTITPAWQRRAARAWLGVAPVEIPGGHCPNVGRPDTLADALERIA